MKKLSLLLFMLPALFVVTAFADSQQDERIEITVQIAGENVIVDLSLVIPATRQQVWAVLTDFDHMANFVSNLKESKVVSTSADTLKVFQRGSAKYGPISFSFESTREMWLDPFDSIRSRMISGNMRKMEGTTQLVEEVAQTRIIYHTDSIPGVWIPPIVGKVFIEHEIREQFREIRNEIIKRKQESGQLPQVASEEINAASLINWNYSKYKLRDKFLCHQRACRRHGSDLRAQVVPETDAGRRGAAQCDSGCVSG